MRCYGSSVWAQTQPGSGFPVSQAITVLVVEDEALIRMDIADQLERMGFAILEAANAREAIDIMASHPAVQVIFTDVDMPGGIDGLELATAVRDRWPPIKIIVTSGHREVGIADLPNDSRFFAKLYRGSAVASAIREMLD
ncbi:MAG: response regulator [Rhizobiaceae bacterium]|nr:MAG: response regulator [Rhizobiaceae bacterium]